VVAAKKVHVGLVGLGKMGNNMRGRMRKAGLKVTGYDPNPAVTDVPDLAGLGPSHPSIALRRRQRDCRKSFHPLLPVP